MTSMDSALEIQKVSNVSRSGFINESNITGCLDLFIRDWDAARPPAVKDDTSRKTRIGRATYFDFAIGTFGDRTPVQMVPP